MSLPPDKDAAVVVFLDVYIRRTEQCRSYWSTVMGNERLRKVSYCTLELLLVEGPDLPEKGTPSSSASVSEADKTCQQEM